MHDYARCGHPRLVVTSMTAGGKPGNAHRAAAVLCDATAPGPAHKIVAITRWCHVTGAPLNR